MYFITFSVLFCNNCRSLRSSARHLPCVGFRASEQRLEPSAKAVQCECCEIFHLPPLIIITYYLNLRLKSNNWRILFTFYAVASSESSVFTLVKFSNPVKFFWVKNSLFSGDNILSSFLSALSATEFCC